MSLEALNNPSIITTTGIGVFVALPYLEKLALDGTIPWMALKTANLLSYVVQCVAVSQPGRIDGSSSSSQSSGGEKKEKLENAKKTDEDEKEKEMEYSTKEMQQLSSGRTGRTLVAPAGWAFAIWGPIFLGELVFVTSQAFLPSSSSSSILPILKRASVPFTAAQIFQSLWCAAFRPKYNTGNHMLISAGLLGSVAYSLSKAHGAFTTSSVARTNYTPLEYIMYFLPISLHFGWTTAASIVNLNGAISLKENVSFKLVAIVGHASVIGATLTGIMLSVKRSAPVYGGVITWALLAVADGMKKRVQVTEKEEDINRVGVYGAKTQLWLSRVGALLTGVATVFVAVSLRRKEGGYVYDAVSKS